MFSGCSKRAERYLDQNGTIENKDASAATIGDIRRLGLEALTASCLQWNGGCGRSGRVLFDALDLVDTTIFLNIPRARRLTCSVCGTRSFAIMPYWARLRRVRQRPGVDHLMGWHVITQEADGVEGRSSALASEAAALGFARDLIASGVEVLRIEAPDGTISRSRLSLRRARSSPIATS